MATSKMKSIKSTLRKAIDYIVNPDKTDGGLLVYSHGCSVETADLEMELTAKQGTGRGGRIAYHLMQSFSPDDDITPEKALQLGIEYARKVTGGKYEFVVSTHIDKEHIHNHIIFNAVDYVNHRKYHSDVKDKYRIRDINDEICKANNLSVLPRYEARKKSNYRNSYIKKGSESWIKKNKDAIDRAISEAETFEDFLLVLEMEGYVIKKGKHMTFLAPGQEKGTRGYTIGNSYTEAAIRDRIANKDKEPVLQSESISEKSVGGQTSKVKEGTISKKKTFPSKRINLLADISKNIKAQQSEAYEHALVRSNINTLVKTMNFLIEHKITIAEDFQAYVDGKNAEFLLYRMDIVRLENEMMELSEKINFTQNYKKNAHLYYESRRAKDPAAFAREHGDQLVLLKASEIYFKRKGLKPNELNLAEMFEHYKELKTEIGDLAKKQKSLKREIRELEVVADNIEQAIGVRLLETAERREAQETEERKREQEK